MKKEELEDDHSVEQLPCKEQQPTQQLSPPQLPLKPNCSTPESISPPYYGKYDDQYGGHFCPMPNTGQYHTSSPQMFQNLMSGHYPANNHHHHHSHHQDLVAAYHHHPLSSMYRAQYGSSPEHQNEMQQQQQQQQDQSHQQQQQQQQNQQQASSSPSIWSTASSSGNNPGRSFSLVDIQLNSLFCFIGNSPTNTGTPNSVISNNESNPMQQQQQVSNNGKK